MLYTSWAIVSDEYVYTNAVFAQKGDNNTILHGVLDLTRRYRHKPEMPVCSLSVTPWRLCWINSIRTGDGMRDYFHTVADPDNLEDM